MTLEERGTQDMRVGATTRAAPCELAANHDGGACLEKAASGKEH